MQLLVNIDVDDLARAEAFYVAAFGLRAGRRFGDGALELLGAAVPIYLLEKAAGTRANDASPQRRDYARHWTPLHVDVVVDDVAPAVERAVAAGATLERAATDTAWGRIAMLGDPFGHGFCVLSFNERGYDAIAKTP